MLLVIWHPLFICAVAELKFQLALNLQYRTNPNTMTHYS